MAYLSIGQQVLQLLKDNFGSEFVSYFWGDPQLIGQSSMPAIVVEESGAKTSVDNSSMDLEVKTIQIKVVYDKREDWGASDTVDTTFAKIRDIIDGRDPTTGMYLEKSLKGILRTSFTLTNPLQPTNAVNTPPAIDQTMESRYYIERRPEDTFTMEGRLTMTISELVVVPNRI